MLTQPVFLFAICCITDVPGQPCLAAHMLHAPKDDIHVQNDSVLQWCCCHQGLLAGLSSGSFFFATFEYMARLSTAVLMVRLAVSAQGSATTGWLWHEQCSRRVWGQRRGARWWGWRPRRAAVEPPGHWYLHQPVPAATLFKASRGRGRLDWAEAHGTGWLQPTGQQTSLQKIC